MAHPAATTTLLSDVFGAAPVGVGLLDRDLRYVWVNDALAAMNGVPAAGHEGRTVREVLGDQAGSMEEPLRGILAGGEAIPALEVTIPPEAPGASERRFRAAYFPVHGEGGAVTGAAAVVLETTEERHSRAQLQLTEERLRLVLEGTATGMWEWHTDSDEVRWSAGMGPLYGLARGASPPGYAAYQRLVHPDDRDGLRDAIGRALATGDDFVREYRAVWPDGTVRWLRSRGHVVRGDDGRPLMVAGLAADVHDEKVRRLAAEYVAEATHALSRSLDVEKTLLQIADLAVPALADWCAVHLADEHGELTQVAVAHTDPEKVRLARELEARFPPDPEAPTGAFAVVRTGRSELLPEISRELLECTLTDPEQLELVRALELRSALIVPMPSGGQVHGAITFVYAESGRRYGPAELELAEELGRRAGLAVENAGLLRREREAREELERAHARLAALEALTDVGLARLGLGELLRELLARIADICDASGATVLLVDENRRVLRVRATVGWEAEVAEGVTIPVGRGVAGRVFTARRPRIVDDLDAVEVASPYLRENARSLMAVPLIAEGRPLGVLHVTSDRPGAFGQEDLDLLRLVGDRVARATAHAQLLEQAQLTALTLQRSLLPQALPYLPGVEVAARYLPGEDGTEVGGDWYDVFRRPDRRIVIVVGDIVGRGVRAAAVMGHVRNAVRAYALEAETPEDALRRTDRLAGHIEDLDFATLVLCFVDADAGRLLAASAGHPPPLLVTEQGSAFLDVPQGPPLGLGDARTGAAIALEPGALLLLYTDGLVERRGDDLLARLEALRLAAARAPGHPAALLDAVVDAMLGRRRHPDDVALLAARFTG